MISSGNFACLLILWLFVMDKKRRSGISSALWLVVIWVSILASRRASEWLAGGTALGKEADGNSLTNASPAANS